ncbi:MAG: DUF3649 domain-containing protein [Pseudomonadota bacterium]
MATTMRSPERLRRAAAVAVRTGLATIGGYWAAHAFAAGATVVLPFARPDRVTAGTLLSFLVWVFVALHAFAARSTWSAVWRTALLAAVPMAVALAFPDAGSRP